MVLLSLSPSACHVTLHAAAIATATVTHILCEVVRCLATESSVPNALFQVSSRNVSATFPLEVSMDSWAENIWILINIWMLAWLLHAISTVIQRSVLGRLCCHPEIHSPLFFLIWTTINMWRMSGIIHWSRYELVEPWLCRCLVATLSCSTLGMSYRNLAQHRAWLQINTPAHTCWIRYLVQNGIASFCCWSLLEVLVSGGQVVRYLGGLRDPLVSSLILTLILLLIITWVVLEGLVFPGPLQTTYSVYPTLIVGLGSVFTAGYRLPHMTANTLYCGVLMVFATCCSVFKTISSCFEADDPSVTSVVEFTSTSGGCKTVCSSPHLRDHPSCAGAAHMGGSKAWGPEIGLSWINKS